MVKKKLRLTSAVMAVSMMLSSTPLVLAHAEDNSLSLDVTSPFVSTKDSGTTYFTIDGTNASSNSYRIPAMVTLKDGTMVAATDIRWNTTYDGGGLDTLVAYSSDGGVTWEYSVANYLGDNGNSYNYNSTCFIDPSLTVAADGQTVYMLCDLYPYGIALNGNGSQTAPSTTVGLTDDGYLKLSMNNHNTYDYYLKEGQIYSSDGSVDSGYTVDAHFNLYDSAGELISNLFYSDSPYKVVRTGFLYLTSSSDGGKTWSDPMLLNLKTSSENVCLVGPGRGLTTSDGTMIFPIYSYGGSTDSQRTGFIYSADGVNWSRTDSSVSWSSESAVVEIGEGTLRFFYRNGTANLCYVDYTKGSSGWSNGSWGSSVNTGVATNSNTQLSAITYSKKTEDGNQVVLVSCPTGANAAGSDNNNGAYRLNGKIFAGVVNSDGTMSWTAPILVTPNLATSVISSTPYTESAGFFAYSCLTERSDGSIAILYENRENAWGAGDSCYYTMNMKAYSANDLGIPFASESSGGESGGDTGETTPDAPSSVITANGVTLTGNRVVFTKLTATGVTAPTAAYIKNAIAYDVVPETADGVYTGTAKVTVAIPDGWDSTKVFGYVKESDGKLTVLPGTVSAQNTFTFTTPHFSEIGLFEATALADVSDLTVTLTIGETSQTITVSDTENLGTAGIFTTGDGAVKYTVSHINEAGGYTPTKVTSLTAGAEIVISDGNGNYLVRNGTSITTTTDPASATKWTVGTTTSWGTTYYTLSNGGYYLRPRSGTNNYSLNVSNSSSNTAYRNWSYSANTGLYYGNRYLRYNNGWSVAQNVTSNYGAAYTLTQTEAVKKTTVTFTALDVTPGTQVTIGDKTYTVIVNPKESTKQETLLTGNSLELDALSDLGLSGFTDITYEIIADDANAITLSGATVTAGTATGEATVKATVKNSSGNTVGTVTYTITVSDIVIDEVHNIYVSVDHTATVSGLSGGTLLTEMLDTEIATAVLSSGVLTVTGNVVGKTAVVVQLADKNVQFNIYVNPKNEGSGADTTKSLYVNIKEITHCTVYYAVNGGPLYKVEGTGVLIDQTYTDGFNIIFFAKPDEGYALTTMSITNSGDQYYRISNGSRPDGSDSDAWPFVDPDADTIPSSGNDAAWKSGHGFRWSLLEGNMDIAGMRDLFTRALALGVDGATTFTKNSTADFTTDVSIIAEKLPTLDKTITLVNGNPYTEGTSLQIGDVITYQFTITSYSTNIEYTGIVLKDSKIGYNLTIPDNRLDTAGTYTYTATYTLNAADIDKYTGGVFYNDATLEYEYSSTYSSGVYDYYASASVPCKINGIVYYVWMSGLPTGITGNTTDYPLPASEVVTYGATVTVKPYTGATTYAVIENGVIVGTWTFKGWQYNGVDYAAGATLEMPVNGSVEFVGIWEYTDTPAYKVIYEWTNAPSGVTLPTDANTYYEGQTYTVNGTYYAGYWVEVDGVRYTFSGWKLDGTVVSGDQTMGTADVTLVGVWTSAQMLTTLTIRKTGSEAIDVNQSFLFRVTGDGVDLTVTVHGNGSITITGLKVGVTYTVTEITDWSWRYSFKSWEFTTHGSAAVNGTDNGAAVTLGESDNEIIFTNERPNIYWLDGDHYAVNIFKKEQEGA